MKREEERGWRRKREKGGKCYRLKEIRGLDRENCEGIPGRCGVG